MVGIAASALLLAGAGASSWRYRAEIESAYERVIERSTTPAQHVGTMALAPAPVSSPALPAAQVAQAKPDSSIPPSAAGSSSALAPNAVNPGAPNASTPSDTVHWVPAVARTWVNVRNEAGRENQVVGVIRTGSRALLGGTGREGWRQVRSDSATGWVNPKHFVVDSVRTRG